ncbi:MAG: AmmeMemoRadiSam system protein A [Bacteroidota bacterium]
MLTQDARRELLMLARDAILRSLRGRLLPLRAFRSPELNRPGGMFVTLRLGGDLRGCIGYIRSDEPLGRVVQEIAPKAAFEDLRFPPVTAEEVEKLKLDISILSPMEAVADPVAVKPGLHGLMVEKGGCRGLLLPQVAVEYGWTREEFLNHTARKAGLPPEAWRDPNAVVYTFTAEIIREEELRSGDAEGAKTG